MYADGLLPRLRGPRLICTGVFVLLACRCASNPSGGQPGLDGSALIAAARKAMAAGNYATAQARLEALLERPDAAAHREEALYRRAVCLARQERYEDAFEAFKAFARAYPLSRYTVEKELFRIGVALIKGASSGFLGIPRALGMTLEGPDVLRFLIEVNPTGERAADAERIIAQAYFDAGDFHLAELEYQALLDDHPGSIWQSLAEYRIPLCRLLQSRGARYDRKLLEDALKGFKDYERRHPGGSYANLARRRAKEVTKLLAEKNYRLGDFYLSDKRVGASVFYFKLTIQDFPETVWARRAADRLARIAQGYSGTHAARVARDYLELIRK